MEEWTLISTLISNHYHAIMFYVDSLREGLRIYGLYGQCHAK